MYIWLKRFSLSFFLTAVTLLSIHFNGLDDNPQIDVSPYITSNNFGIRGGSFPYPLKWVFNYSSHPGMINGTLGIALHRNKYFLNTWNLNNPCFTILNPGPETYPDINTLDSILVPPYTGQIRDITEAPDGSGNLFLWGGKAGYELFKLDSNLSVVSSFSLPGISVRGIAWDPNRKGFWITTFGDNIKCVDTLGNILGILNSGAAITSKYGLAWDSVSARDSAFIWAWSQGGGTSGYNTLYKINIATDYIAGVYEFTNLSTSSYAGGANIVKNGNQHLLLLNVQNTSVLCYTLSSHVDPSCYTSYMRDNINKSIPDNGVPLFDTLFITEEVDVSREINVILDTVRHTWVGDLTMTLTHNGITDTLMNRPGNATGNPFGTSADNFFGTKLSDDGLIRMDSITSSMQPFTSPPNYKPGTKYGMDSLSKFSNTSINGAWILKIVDNAPGDPGTLNRWGICLKGALVNVSNNNQIPGEYFLSQNYPNPFNPSTKIDFSIPKAGNVKLSVYDITGKEIAILRNGYQNSGVYTVEFNAGNLSSGVYFYRIEAGNFVSTKRMILLK